VRQAVESLLKLGVTAIEAENDEVAFRVAQACRSLGARVPQDVSVAGFDDSMIATAYGADLTTVHQDFRGMGELAAKIAVSELSGRHEYDFRQVLPVSLVERSSTGPA
jgi:DNA-binding LacI/PurR family transcriptional regulator